MEDTTDTTLYVQHPARAPRGGLKEGREGEENTVALKEQQKIPRRRRNKIGNADYIRNERVWWLRKGREGEGGSNARDSFRSAYKSIARGKTVTILTGF